jgi:hypothetical protein
MASTSFLESALTCTPRAGGARVCRQPFALSPGVEHGRGRMTLAVAAWCEIREAERFGLVPCSVERRVGV